MHPRMHTGRIDGDLAQSSPTFERASLYYQYEQKKDFEIQSKLFLTMRDKL